MYQLFTFAQKQDHSSISALRQRETFTLQFQSKVGDHSPAGSGLRLAASHIDAYYKGISRPTSNVMYCRRRVNRRGNAQSLQIMCRTVRNTVVQPTVHGFGYDWWLSRRRQCRPAQARAHARSSSTVTVPAALGHRPSLHKSPRPRRLFARICG